MISIYMMKLKYFTAHCDKDNSWYWPHHNVCTWHQKLWFISNIKYYTEHFLVSSNCYCLKKANFLQIEINKYYRKTTVTQGKLSSGNAFHKINTVWKYWLKEQNYWLFWNKRKKHKFLGINMHFMIYIYIYISILFLSKYGYP